MTTNFGGPPDGQGQSHGGLPSEGPYLVPAGMPPGVAYMHDERPPEGVYYFRIYGGIAMALSAITAIFGLVMLLMPLLDASSASASASAATIARTSDVGAWLGGLLYGGFGTALFVAWLLALFGGRRPWVHTLGTVLIALGMTQICCLPLQIPLLISWLKPETKRWYGAG